MAPISQELEPPANPWQFTWHEVIDDPTHADAILDRLVHNAHRVELVGESLRGARAKGAKTGLTENWNGCDKSRRSTNAAPGRDHLAKRGHHYSGIPWQHYPVDGCLRRNRQRDLRAAGDRRQFDRPPPASYLVVSLLIVFVPPSRNTSVFQVPTNLFPTN
jgi:hypothetical protein